MRKRPWQVEWRAQARSDGLDRLGQMVKLVIDHAGVVPDVQPEKDLRPPWDHDAEQHSEEIPP